MVGVIDSLDREQVLLMSNGSNLQRILPLILQKQAILFQKDTKDAHERVKIYDGFVANAIDPTYASLELLVSDHAMAKYRLAALINCLPLDVYVVCDPISKDDVSIGRLLQSLREELTLIQQSTGTMADLNKTRTSWEAAYLRLLAMQQKTDSLAFGMLSGLQKRANYRHMWYGK